MWAKLGRAPGTWLRGLGSQSSTRGTRALPARVGQTAQHPVPASVGNDHGTSSLRKGRGPSLALPSAWAHAQLGTDPLAVCNAGQEKQRPERKFSTAFPSLHCPLPLSTPEDLQGQPEARSWPRRLLPHWPPSFCHPPSGVSNPSRPEQELCRWKT